MAFTIKVPCSSANIGPGFDVIGLALSIYLELHVTTTNTTAKIPLNCAITYEGESEGEVDLDPEVNLITRVALYVLRCHNQRAFPVETHVHIKNPIPLGRGLGSSGAAVTAGVMLERHPDNVTAALYGGFVGTYLNVLKPEDLAWKEIPLSEVLPAPAGGIDTGAKPPEPPIGIGHYKKFPWSPRIKAVVIIPNFELSTAKAREVLPEMYSRADVVFNLQRATLLPSVLSQSPLDPDMIYLAMQDKVHQHYRKHLVPGLTEILNSMNPSTQPGLLGICLSGAGPTILALATTNFNQIAERIMSKFKQHGITCRWEVLEPAEDGAIVERKKECIECETNERNPTV
ncbi:homoserine kinase [Paracoccidioides lutzii Pb01]|uniref:Homoserine kinase n=1 Tax=Paracoccidioides lutzii (strain ATCC MYA-826 / Pb01) TaxID=502779 RepID=C1H0Q4_PARBA|nr:homoserine kinase [Paracoccidioides lutzii Pb01]EEH33298.2 homoserine kinase [Paracoccidioides lutzii Pb01]